MVFPAPLGPIRERISPSEIKSEGTLSIIVPPLPTSRFFASRILSSVDSPDAVKALAKVISNTTQPDFRRDAIEGLARIGTAEAVQELINIVNSADEYLGSLKSTTRAKIVDIYNTTQDPAIRSLCQPIAGGDKKEP